MKKVTLTGVMKQVMFCFLLVFMLVGCVKLKAFAATTPISLTEISRPGDIEALKNADKGVIYQTEQGTGYNIRIFSFSLNERGWVVFETTSQYSFDYRWGDWSTNILYKNLSLTSKIDRTMRIGVANKIYRHLYYLDAGTYYIAACDEPNQSPEYIFGYFLPDSKSISHTLEKAEDGTSYTTNVSFSAKMGTSVLVNSIVDVSKICTNNVWSGAETSADDKYIITKNGEYTVKVSFTDTEWKYYPAMYSFSVYDIVSKPAIPQSPTVTLKNSGKKAIKVFWKKISNVSGYEVQYSLNKNFSKAKTKKCLSSASNIKISKLKAKKKYYVRIRAFKEFNEKKIYSKWSKAKNIKTKS